MRWPWPVVYFAELDGIIKIGCSWWVARSMSNEPGNAPSGVVFSAAMRCSMLQDAGVPADELFRWVDAGMEAYFTPARRTPKFTPRWIDGFLVRRELGLPTAVAA